jgi:flagellar basal-body rod protein FlgB
VNGGPQGELKIQDTDHVRFGPVGIEPRPGAARDNLLFHDRNDRNLEVLMQHLAENTMTHNYSMTMMRNQFDMMRTAISERI